MKSRIYILECQNSEIQSIENNESDSKVSKIKKNSFGAGT